MCLHVFPTSFQDLAVGFGGPHVEARSNIFALQSLFANRIMSQNGKGLAVQAFKNISLSAFNSIKNSALILGVLRISLPTFPNLSLAKN